MAVLLESTVIGFGVLFNLHPSAIHLIFSSRKNEATKHMQRASRRQRKTEPNRKTNMLAFFNFRKSYPISEGAGYEFWSMKDGGD
ncbi:unnamed protein product [Linum trigynum]|uniref:Uncharacterized protein n=1 Tax=Linum trigynum TaxID=586398 RepID=A0AAV2CAT4_9ROSI